MTQHIPGYDNWKLSSPPETSEVCQCGHEQYEHDIPPDCGKCGRSFHEYPIMDILGIEGCEGYEPSSGEGLCAYCTCQGFKYPLSRDEAWSD